MPKYIDGAEMKRITIRLPENTLNEIDSYIQDAGMYRTYFFTAALILGARTLAGVFASSLPGKPPTPSGDEIARLQESLYHESVLSSLPDKK